MIKIEADPNTHNFSYSLVNRGSERADRQNPFRLRSEPLTTDDKVKLIELKEVTNENRQIMFKAKSLKTVLREEIKKFEGKFENEQLISILLPVAALALYLLYAVAVAHGIAYLAEVAKLSNDLILLLILLAVLLPIVCCKIADEMCQNKFEEDIKEFREYNSCIKDFKYFVKECDDIDNIDTSDKEELFKLVRKLVESHKASQGAQYVLNIERTRQQTIEKAREENKRREAEKKEIEKALQKFVVSSQEMRS